MILSSVSFSLFISSQLCEPRIVLGAAERGALYVNKHTCDARVPFRVKHFGVQRQQLSEAAPVAGHTQREGDTHRGNS